MVNALIIVYLVAPALLGAVAIVYALTRAKDRIQLATLALFAASVLYLAQAYELTKQGGSTGLLGLALGAYAFAIYVCMAALGVYFKRWAWRAALVCFGLHVVLGLFSASAALEQGAKGLLVLLAYFSVAALGIWALLHKGTRAAIGSAAPSEA